MSRDHFASLNPFFDLVNVTEACWYWLGRQRGKGYGRFGSNIYAHRWLFEQLYGCIPVGYELDHLCRVPICVNPDHLDVVTHRENVMRGTSPSALNATKTHCPKGHPYDLLNTQWRMRRGTLRRECKPCKREWDRINRRALSAVLTEVKE